MGTELVCKDENLLEMDGGGDGTTLRIYLMSLHCTPKCGQFYVVHILSIKNECTAVRNKQVCLAKSSRAADSQRQSW